MVSCHWDINMNWVPPDAFLPWDSHIYIKYGKYIAFVEACEKVIYNPSEFIDREVDVTVHLQH